MLRFIRRNLEVNALAVVVAEDGLSALEIRGTGGQEQGGEYDAKSPAS